MSNIFNVHTVEIFKTDIENQNLADQIVFDLNQLYPDYHINFDFEDCDNVLRIEANNGIDIPGVLNYGRLNNIKISLINY